MNLDGSVCADEGLSLFSAQTHS